MPVKLPPAAGGSPPSSPAAYSILPACGPTRSPRPAVSSGSRRRSRSPVRAACSSACWRAGSAALTCRRSSGRRNTFVDLYGRPGYPLHEVVGEVVAGELPAGTRIVGWAEHHLGLAEYFVARVDAITADDDFTDVEATVVQPLCTVLHQLDRIPDVRGKRAAVIGQGSIGLLFSHALKARGAAWVTGVDRVDRSRRRGGVRRRRGRLGRRRRLGARARGAASGHRRRGRRPPCRPARGGGHRARPARHRARVRRPRRVPLRVPVHRFFRKHGTLIAGAATDRATALANAARLPARAPRAAGPLHHDRARSARRPAGVRDARVHPTAGRLKVVLEV